MMSRLLWKSLCILRSIKVYDFANVKPCDNKASKIILFESKIC